MAEALIDLSQLTPPDLRKVLDYESVRTARIERLKELFEAAGITYDAEALESDPAVILQEADAYRELLALGEINDTYIATLLAFATGTDLDHLGATLHLLPRLEGEGDTRYRQRIVLASEQKAGGRLSGYRAEALAAHLDVTKAGAYVDRSSGEPVVRVPIMAADNPPDAALVATVQARLDREDVRQATDIVEAEPVQVMPVAIDLELEHMAGPDPAVLTSRANAAIDKVLASRHAPGRDLPRSAIIGAAAVVGVERVVLTAPATDVIAGPRGLIEVTGVKITSELVDG